MRSYGPHIVAVMSLGARSPPASQSAAGPNKRTDTIMTATPQYVAEPGLDPLAARAVEHVWMHFTRMSGYTDGHVPVIVRGEGAYVWDDSGKR